MAVTGDDALFGSGAPQRAVPVPSAVLAVAGGRRTRAVWVNELGGVTYELSDDGGRWFVKWAPISSGLDLAAEAARLRWAAAFTVVPRVVDEGSDVDGSWLLTEALQGEMAITDRWKANPAVAVTAIGAGLRQMHDALPVAQCPFTWSAEERLQHAQQRARQRQLAPRDWHPDHQHLTVADALTMLEDVPSIDQAVVCHGDTCAPNTLIDDQGRCTGHVDVGALGVADRWADLAVATWSTTWNYGPGWEIALLDAYGIGLDEQRTRYYRLMWDLT